MRRLSIPTLAFAAAVSLVSVGCSSTGDRSTADRTEDQRLEETWGPGELAALVTGTVSSKDRNLWVNIPLASWYVREQDRKGTALLGGALAYDMVTVERTEDGRPENQKLTSVGFLGIAGNMEERKLDGTRGYAKRHWLFPFYRYKNVNGKRTVYPLFIFPITLADDPGTGPSYDPIALSRSSGAPIDPSSVKPVDRPIRSSELIDPGTPDPGRIVGSPGLGSSDEDDTGDPWPSNTRRAPNPAVRRTDDQTAAGRWRPERSSGGTEPRTGSSAGSSGGTQPITPAVTPDSSSRKATTYRVKSGDTLFSIAKNVYGRGDDWKRIYEANRDQLKAPDRLPHGILLKIPR